MVFATSHMIIKTKEKVTNTKRTREAVVAKEPENVKQKGQATRSVGGIITVETPST